MRRVLAAAALLLLGGCGQSGPVESKSVEDRQVLDSFPVARGLLTYQLSRDGCSGGDCVLEVRLMDRESVLDTLALEWKIASRDIRKHSEKVSGAGDPLDKTQQEPAWSAGHNDRHVITQASVIRLSPVGNGLLIHQTGGFDHVKRRHDLYVARGGKLERVWSAEEGAGPHWSSVDIAQASAGDGQVLVYFRGFQPPVLQQPDTLEVTTHRWDEGAGKIAETTGFPLFAVVVGSFDSPAKARDAQTAAGDCLGDFSVLGSDPIPGAAKEKFVIAAVTGRKELAAQTLAKTLGCAGALTGRLAELSTPVKL